MYKTAVISLTFMLLCAHPCVSQNRVEIPQDAIIGKWKLVRVVVPRRPSITYSSVEVILEFKTNNTLTVQNLRQGNNNTPWNSGDYPYFFIGSDYGTKIQIGNTSWWYRISEKGLMIGQGPVDGLNYFFEKYFCQFF